jgi:hypothetical protein
MNLKNRFNYYKRLIETYIISPKSHISFWHEKPSINEDMDFENPASGYYMTFFDKSMYSGPFDNNGIPLLDYKGKIGIQYNPTGISQYALGMYNRYLKENNDKYREIFLNQCDWLVNNLERNEKGIYVWIYHFDWNYSKTSKPWYSALAQGCGISSLIRAYIITKDVRYLETAMKAFISFTKTIKEGGVTYIDDEGNIWFEEEINEFYSHILNGFIWAIWGIYDLYLITKNNDVKMLYDKAVMTLEKNIHKYDVGYWSLYGLYPLRFKMISSPFYHSLHIVQLRIMYKLTKKEIFNYYANKWENYKRSIYNRSRALLEKIIFKLLYF